MTQDIGNPLVVPPVNLYLCMITETLSPIHHQPPHSFVVVGQTTPLCMLQRAQLEP